MSKLLWYWRRMRAMGPGELMLRARKKCAQFVDAQRERDWAAVKLVTHNVFPKLPPREQAPESLREALRQDTDAILAGHWRAFGHLDLKVDDPPKWHCDYRVEQDLLNQNSAFNLDHRSLPRGAEIKLIWELSRWYQLARLAQAAYVLNDERAGEKCLLWLEDWVKSNPPYRGWNWTSALEAGIRLVQFTWMDALLSGLAEARGFEAELDTLRYEILPPHGWYVWRHKSFGSSANNHLIGELTGLILATVRWPALAQWGASLENLQSHWESEVLKQFAEDGGNREQALNYHLFSWEFCWQARQALVSAGRAIHPAAEKRLEQAARFYGEAQASQDPWDYGDSDNGCVTPLFLDERRAAQEWHAWLRPSSRKSALSYWLDDPPWSVPPLGRGQPKDVASAGDWWVYPHSGIGVCESGNWWLRWDLSPLGYLKTAAHGHLDALHLSIWFKQVAMVVDPGTGTYYADSALRTWLASQTAHNGPCPIGGEFPQRAGPFLWAARHDKPEWKMIPAEADSPQALEGGFSLPGGRMVRIVSPVRDGQGWLVDDRFIPRSNQAADFTVRWQFAPGTQVKRLEDRRFKIQRQAAAIEVEASGDWSQVELVELGNHQGPSESADTREPFAGVVSPSFCQTERAPFLLLTAKSGLSSDKPCLFRTRFLGCE